MANTVRSEDASPAQPQSSRHMKMRYANFRITSSPSGNPHSDSMSIAKLVANIKKKDQKSIDFSFF
jgi:hypothetical protein